MIFKVSKLTPSKVNAPGHCIKSRVVKKVAFFYKGLIHADVPSVKKIIMKTVSANSIQGVTSRKTDYPSRLQMKKMTVIKMMMMMVIQI